MSNFISVVALQFAFTGTSTYGLGHVTLLACVFFFNIKFKFKVVIIELFKFYGS